MEQEILTAGELAKKLKVSKAAVRRWTVCRTAGWGGGWYALSLIARWRGWSSVNRG